MLNSIFNNNPDVNYILNKHRETEIITKALNLIADLHGNDDVMNKIIHKAYIMDSGLDADYDDIVAILLYRYIKDKKLRKHKMLDIFGEELGEKLFNYSALSPVEVAGVNTIRVPLSEETGQPIYDEYQCYELHIMNRVCDKMYERNARKLKKMHFGFNILTAYQKAREAHYWVLRNSGEPYISHPLRVAEILIDFGVETPIIAAALLHDTVEDTDITIEELENEFGSQIADYVDAVTAIEDIVGDDDDPQKAKLEADRKTFNKLADSVDRDPANMIPALYVKAADRIHNLRTMDDMSQEKITKKIIETKYYLDLFDRYKMYFFTDIIRDEIMSLTNHKLYNAISRKYNSLLYKNRNQTKQLFKTIKNFFDEDFNQNCELWTNALGFDFTIFKKTYTPHGILTMSKNECGIHSDVLDYINKYSMPIYDVYIILDPLSDNSNIKVFATTFIKTSISKLIDNKYAITDYYFEKGNNRFIVKIEDDYHNTLRCIVSTRADYYKSLCGKNENIFINRNTSTREEKAPKKISIKLLDGKKHFIKEDATVLDVAFMIHDEVGLAAIDATVNGITKPLNSTVQDEDLVIINASTVREGSLTKEFTPQAKIEWFNYVETEEAKRCLTEYFQNKYEK